MNELTIIVGVIIAACAIYLITRKKSDETEAGVVVEQAPVEVAPVTAPIVEEKPARKPRAAKAAPAKAPAKKPAAKKAAPAKKPAVKKAASKKA